MIRPFSTLTVVIILLGTFNDLPAAPQSVVRQPLPVASPKPPASARPGEPKVILDTKKAKGLVYAPIPEYPKEALKNHWGGFGIFEVQFRRDGKPWAVYVTMSTGHQVLDDAAVRTLWQWRSWKRYKLIVHMVPITFAPSGEQKGATKWKQIYPP